MVGGARAEVGRMGGVYSCRGSGAQMKTQLTDGALTPPWLVCGPCPPPASPSSACLWPGESQQIDRAFIHPDLVFRVSYS